MGNSIFPTWFFHSFGFKMMFYYFYICLSTTETKSGYLFKLIVCTEFIYKIKQDKAIMKKVGPSWKNKCFLLSKCLLNITYAWYNLHQYS